LAHSTLAGASCQELCRKLFIDTAIYDPTGEKCFTTTP
jgi:hypothetical protein